MKLKEALTAAFARERRPSRRAELLAFVRRYAAPNAAVTHYRGTGDASDVLLPFLADCGVEAGKSVTLERSSLDKGAWQLRWSADKSVGEFVSLCRRAGEGAADAVLMEVAKGVDGEEALARKFPADPESPAAQTGRVEIPEGAGVPDGRPAFAERLAERTRKILETVAGLEGSGRSTVMNLRETEGVVATYAGRLLAAGKTLIAPLEVIEAFVRLDAGAVKGTAYYGPTPQVGVFTVPPALFTTPVPAWHNRVEVLARGITRGKEDVGIPVEGTLSMPLDALLGENEYGGPDVAGFGDHNVSPLKGFLSNDEADFPRDAYAVLTFGNAHLACSSKWPVPDRVTPATFAANDPVSFWDYVRWLYDMAYAGVAACGLTRWARVGCHRNCGPSFHIDERNLGDDDDFSGASWYWRVVKRAPNTSVAAFYAVMLMDSASGLRTQARHRACDLFTTPPGRSVKVLSAEEAKARVAGSDSDAVHGSNHSRKDELPLEWFLMTHSAGKLWGARTAEGGMISEGVNDENKRRSSLGFMRTFAASTSEAVLSRACSLGVNPELRPVQLPDGTGFEFNVASSFYSTLVGLLRRFAPGDGPVPTKEWAGQRRWQYAIHDPQSVVCAAYSGVVTDLSPNLGDAVGTAGSDFPDIKSQQLYEFVGEYENASHWFTTTPQFTDFVSELASGDAKYMLRMAQRTKGTPRRRVLVVETNIDAERYFGGLSVDEVRRLDDRLRCLFMQAFMYRSDDTIGLVEVPRNLDGLYVAISDPSGATRIPSWIKARYPHGRALDSSLIEDCGHADQSKFYKAGSMPDGFGPVVWQDDLKVGARIDTFGRLYLVFEAKGDVAQACHVHWRHHAGLPVLSAALASLFGDRGSPNPFVALGPMGRADQEAAMLVLEERFGSFSEDMYRKTMKGGDWAFRGWLTPLALMHTQNWVPPEVPKRNWFEYGAIRACAADLL